MLLRLFLSLGRFMRYTSTTACLENTGLPKGVQFWSSSFFSLCFRICVKHGLQVLCSLAAVRFVLTQNALKGDTSHVPNGSKMPLVWSKKIARLNFIPHGPEAPAKFLMQHVNKVASMVFRLCRQTLGSSVTRQTSREMSLQTVDLAKAWGARWGKERQL